MSSTITKKSPTDFSIEAIIGQIGNHLSNCCATSLPTITSPNNFTTTAPVTSFLKFQCQAQALAQHPQIHPFNQLLRRFDTQLKPHHHRQQTLHQLQHHTLDSKTTSVIITKDFTNNHDDNDDNEEGEDECEIDVVNFEQKKVEINEVKTIDDDLSFYQYPAKHQKRYRPKKHICPICSLSLSNRGQLISHIRSHTGERPFKCDHQTCNKAFTRNEELTRHKRIHTGQKPYPCHICSKRFGRKDHLKKHVRTHTKRGICHKLLCPPKTNCPQTRLVTSTTSLTSIQPQLSTSVTTIAPIQPVITMHQQQFHTGYLIPAKR